MYQCFHKDNGFIYCGQYSTFTIYPNFNRLNITKTVLVFVYYSISAFFTVMDKNSVVSLWNNTYFSTKVKSQSVLLIRKESILFTYFLQVRKSYFITVTISQQLNLMHWLLYDGPLFQSRIMIETTRRTVKLSSFRCLLQFLVNERESSLEFNYSSIRIPVNSNVYIDGNCHISVPLPNAECNINNNLCALNVFAKYGNQVNVSVIKMTYKGIASVTCKYAGLVATQHLGVKDYKETITLCESHNGNFSQSRHFFSYDSSMIIVLYWYGNEDVIDATISLSITKCKPVEICPCTYYYLCMIEREDYTTCNTYLKKQMEFSNVNLEIGIVQMSYWKDREFHFSVNENDCFVMQILRNTSRLFFMGESNCRIDIAPKSISVTNGELYYHLLGSFNHSPVVGSRCFMESCIWFRGTADKFCVDKMDGRRNCNIGANQFRGSKFHSICSTPQSQMGKDTHFVFYSKSRTPTYFNVFSILLFSHVHANGWMDITVFRHSKILTENSLGTKYVSETVRVKSEGSFFREATKSSGLPNQIIMLKFDPKKAIQLRGLGYVIGAYIKITFPRHTVLKWNSTSMQCRSGGIYFISVPGKATDVHIFKSKVRINKSGLHEFHIKRILNNMSISISHVHDNYNKYSYLTNQNMSNCDNILTASLHGFRCFNISIPAQCNFHYILFEKRMTYDYRSSRQREYPSDRHLSSWEQASELCRNAGAYLPSFTNREDLEEWLAWLKLSKDIPPIEAVFIGLRFNGSVLVRWRFRQLRLFSKNCIHTHIIYIFCCRLYKGGKTKVPFPTRSFTT